MIDESRTAGQCWTGSLWQRHSNIHDVWRMSCYNDGLSVWWDL